MASAYVTLFIVGFVSGTCITVGRAGKFKSWFRNNFSVQKVKSLSVKKGTRFTFVHVEGTFVLG